MLEGVRRRCAIAGRSAVTVDVARVPRSFGLDAPRAHVQSRSRVAVFERVFAERDRAVAVLGAATFAALLASYSAFRPVRDALILDGDPEQIPWLFLATFAAVSAASPAWSALLARRSRRAVVPVAFHVFAACALAFFVVLETGIAPVIVGRVFYVWSAVFNLFVVSVFWSLLADLLGPATAARLYGPIAAGGTVGTFVGPALTRGLVGTIGAAGVLVISALLLELAALGVHRLRRVAQGLDELGAAKRGSAAEWPRGEDPDAPAGGGAFTGIARVARSPYLGSIVGYVLCTSIAATFLYLEQASIVKAALANRAERAAYFASVDLWMSGVALVLQLGIARPAIGRWGPGVVLAILPLVQLTGISVLAAAPSLTALALVQVIGRASTHGLTRPARELLFTVVDRDDKYRAKHAIDTIAYRLGDLAASWLQKLLTALAGIGAIVGAAVPLVAIWLGFAAVLGLGFRRRVARPSSQSHPSHYSQSQSSSSEVS